jgi:[amino group carrier protein]-lysine/ornithine hydrolase
VKRKPRGSDRALRKPEPVGLLLDALNIYSPTGHESKLAAFLSGRMKDLGYSRVRRDSVGNVIGEIGHGEHSLLMCGHMDTVPGKLSVKNSAGKIHGRGAADAKSPLCALLLAGAESSDSGLRITFVGVTEEEGDGAGISNFMRRMPHYDYAVFGEPGGASKVTVGYRGRVSVNLTVKTKGGHASSPWAYMSAFAEFESALAKLKEFESSVSRPGDHFNSVSITPTVIRAGDFHNVLPRICESTLDVRIPPGMRSAEVVAGMRGAIGKGSDEVSIKVSAGEATEPYFADTGSNLVRAFQRAIITRLRSKPVFARKTGTGDMNTFASRSRAQCVTYGPGLLGTSHSDSEAVEVKDYLDSIEVLKEAIRELGSRP